MNNSITPDRNTQSIRFFAWTLFALLVLFLINRYLMFYQDFPSLTDTIKHFTQSEQPLESAALIKGLGLISIYILGLASVALLVRKSPNAPLTPDSDRLTRYAAFVVRWAFWSVFLIGFADAVISFLRIENMLVDVVGEELAKTWDQATSRGKSVHFPLMAVALVLAAVTRTLGFIWLAFLVVLAEFGIVVSRFIFSYEQAFMGDLVRFWYAGLFLFASAYTLVEGGHVRVDVLYASMSKKNQARVNALGSLLLGLPLCWTILLLGVETRQSSLISPILSFEISQSAYGMYVKYLMAGFLIVFAVSMAIQFISYFLKNMAVLIGEADSKSEWEAQ